jgi:DNA-binding XRE family transcriptional regulator
MAGTLSSARLKKGLSTRDLAQTSGVALSTLTQLENGSVWGRLQTWRRLAAPVDHVLHLNGDADVAEALRRELDDLRSVTPHIVAHVAHDTGLRVQTVTDLAKTASPSMQTLLAVAAAIEVDIVLEPMAR